MCKGHEHNTQCEPWCTKANCRQDACLGCDVCADLGERVKCHSGQPNDVETEECASWCVYSAHAMPRFYRFSDTAMPCACCCTSGAMRPIPPSTVSSAHANPVLCVRRSLARSVRQVIRPLQGAHTHSLSTPQCHRSLTATAVANHHCNAPHSL